MSREDTHVEYKPGNVEVVELGLDHNGQKQWYADTREGWEEVGSDNTLKLSADHFKVGTKIELTNPEPKHDT